MLFRINSKNGTLESVQSDWVPKELELERYLITQPEAGVRVMSESVFGEPLLLVRNQPQTSAKKRADILALDRAGNGVIIELKRNLGQLGVETQALQYLADFSKYRGANFLRKFPSLSEETVLGFIGGDKGDVDTLNVHSRVILVARSFDESVFSLGEWLTSKGVGFRCIKYSPVQIGEEQFLSFSIAFDRSPEALYSLTFSSVVREPAIFWHNIASPNQAWWDFLITAKQIPACFDNAPEDQGEKVLKKYISGDIIVAYAKGYGAVGWGVIENSDSYRLIKIGTPDDRLHGDCRHRLDVNWKATAQKIDEGMSAEEVRKNFDIYHPISTSVSMNLSDGHKLIKALSARF